MDSRGNRVCSPARDNGCLECNCFGGNNWGEEDTSREFRKKLFDHSAIIFRIFLVQSLQIFTFHVIRQRLIISLIDPFTRFLLHNGRIYLFVQL